MENIHLENLDNNDDMRDNIMCKTIQFSCLSA